MSSVVYHSFSFPVPVGWYFDRFACHVAAQITAVLFLPARASLLRFAYCFLPLVLALSVFVLSVCAFGLLACLLLFPSGYFCCLPSVLSTIIYVSYCREVMLLCLLLLTSDAVCLGPCGALIPQCPNLNLWSLVLLVI